MVGILRNYSERTVILFTEERFDKLKWEQLTEDLKHIFYIKGELHCMGHIKFLNIHLCHNVLIMNSVHDDLF
jgi:hypothetical protein